MNLVIAPFGGGAYVVLFFGVTVIPRALAPEAGPLLIRGRLSLLVTKVLFLPNWSSNECVVWGNVCEVGAYPYAASAPEHEAVSAGHRCSGMTSPQ